MHSSVLAAGMNKPASCLTLRQRFAIHPLKQEQDIRAIPSMNCWVTVKSRRP